MSKTEDCIAARLNQLYLEIEGLYHDYAKRHGLSDSMLWLLYSLQLHHEQPTQRMLCDEWHTSPQTMNYALKVLERKGYVSLESLPGGSGRAHASHRRADYGTRGGRGPRAR